MGTVGACLVNAPDAPVLRKDHLLVRMHSAMCLQVCRCMGTPPIAHCVCRARSQCWCLFSCMQAREAIGTDLTRAVAAQTDEAKEQLRVQQAGLLLMSRSSHSTPQHLLCSSPCMLQGSRQLQSIPDCTSEPAALFLSTLMSVQLERNTL